MRREQAAAGAGLAALLLAGCEHPPAAPPPPASPSPAAAPPPAPTNAPAPAPAQVLPDMDELKQELVIVSSPQVSRERSMRMAGHVQNVDGQWVRFGPVRVGGIQPVLQKTGRADVPFTARLVVTHAQNYSGLYPTQAQAARAPLTFTETRATVYRYEYLPPGTWDYQDETDGPLLDKGPR